MQDQPLRQKGASLLPTLFMLAVFAYAVFVAIQYFPLWLESRSVDSVLSSVEKSHFVKPATSARELEERIASNLNVNDLEGLAKAFQVSGRQGNLLIEVNYQRELNLLFSRKSIETHKQLALR